MVDNKNMDTKKKIDWKKWGPAALATIAIAVFLYLRLRNLGHLLTWDEARFTLLVRSFVGGIQDEGSRYINLHPPLYLWICSFLSKTYNGGAISFELVSIFFSLGTLLLVGRLAYDLFGRWTGALAMFFLAVLPASIVLDTWVKEDAIAIFFLALTIYLFFREKYAWGGVALGLGMLCKETAVFALLALGTYAILSWQRRLVWGVVKVGLIGAAISAWWYLFVSDYVGHFGGFFMGTNPESELWIRSWHYYFSGLPDDIGWIILAAAGAGAAFCLWRRYRGSRAHLLPLAWFLSIYVFLSISAGKPYWMVTPALPALAILASIGVVETAKWVGRHLTQARTARAIQGLLVGAVMLAAFLGAAFTSDADYNIARLPMYWQRAELSRQDAEFLKENMGEKDKLFTIVNLMDRWDPTLFYYMGDTDLVIGAGWMLDSPDDLVSYVRATGADWIYLGRPFTYEDRLVNLQEKITEQLPVEAIYPGDWSLIFKLSK